MILTCDYEGDPKVPPTKFYFQVQEGDKYVPVEGMTVTVEEAGGVLEAYLEIMKRLHEKGLKCVLQSSCIDHLFMDGVCEWPPEEYEGKLVEMGKEPLDQEVFRVLRGLADKFKPTSIAAVAIRQLAEFLKVYFEDKGVEDSLPDLDPGEEPLHFHGTRVGPTGPVVRRRSDLKHCHDTPTGPSSWESFSPGHTHLIDLGGGDRTGPPMRTSPSETSLKEPTSPPSQPGEFSEVEKRCATCRYCTDPPHMKGILIACDHPDGEMPDIVGELTPGVDLDCEKWEPKENEVYAPDCSECWGTGYLLDDDKSRYPCKACGGTGRKGGR